MQRFSYYLADNLTPVVLSLYDDKEKHNNNDTESP